MNNVPLYDVRPIRDIKDMLNSSVSLYKDRAAFWVKSKTSGNYEPITYGRLKEDVDALGTALIDLGLKGKRIALIGENRYEWAISYLATVNGVGIIIPLDRELPENEIESLLTRSAANALIFTSYNKESVLNISSRINNIQYYIYADHDIESNKVISLNSLIEKGKELINKGDRSYIDAEIDPEALSILLFTSATTDKAKAVMLSHRNVCSNLSAMSSMVYIDEKDVFLSVLPIHHTYECTCGFLCPIYRGSSIAYCEGLRHIPKNLQESKATIMLAVPLIYEAIYRRIWDQVSKKPGLEKKLKIAIKISNMLRSIGIDITRKIFSEIHKVFGGNLRLFISGAAGIDPAVAKGFRDLGIHFIQGYGLTECSPIVALNRDVVFRDSAAGLPLPNVEMKIDNPGADGIGEIVVKGPNVMMGYYENPEATKQALRDGWFYTGDLGYIDNNGFVYITGRKKNVIVTKNGKNIYPEEIETLLNRSPYISESLVYGKEDEVYGDVVVSAIIVPDMDKIKEDFGDATLDKQDIHDLVYKEVKAVNKSLVTYKYIKDFSIRNEEFAKTTTRKIKRYMEQVNK
ncbi:MAG TPA: AMP-binding protein [Clostridiaceae bacterium]|nr:AMP-binding protein [Clostridiaceae bacterium]